MFNMGVDVFYRLTSGIKSAHTVNTDFAQTDADSRMINLTRFSLLFPEKRNFFLDGAQYFNFGINGDSQDKNGKMNIPYFSGSIGPDNFVQYDNVSEQLGWQSRFRWILKPGNEILFGRNSSIIEQPEKARYALQQSYTRLKVYYNFRF